MSIIDSIKNISVVMSQNFGTGGSPSAFVGSIGVNKIAIGTTFERYEVTFVIPSITGKTIGTDGNDFIDISIFFDAGSSLDGSVDSLGNQSGTFDIACIQLEEGTVSTKFEEEEMSANLARVSRYYQVLDGNIVLYPESSDISVTKKISARLALSTKMRSAPIVSNGAVFNLINLNYFPTTSLLRVSASSTSAINVASISGPITLDSRL